MAAHLPLGKSNATRCGGLARLRLLRRGLAAALIVTLLGACGGGDDDEATSTVAVTAPPTGSTSTSVAPTAVATTTPSVENSATSSDTATTQPASTTATPPAEPTATIPATVVPEPTVEPSVAIDPASVQIELEEVATDFGDPVFVTNAGDGSGHIFVVERSGTVRLLDGSPFLDIRDRVGSDGSEQGLLGLAFHPDFASNGHLYVNYTNLDGDTRIARFTVGADDLADPSSEVTLIAQDQPAANHNGGMLAFGPDGYLYIGLGDGGGAGDRFGNAQDLDALLGKLLRIDVDAGDPYGIPPTNPFINTPGARPEIWAFGIRNPWRFSFDPETGDLFIGDVGQNIYEEINRQPADSAGGENYGWPIMEATHCFESENCDETGLTMPIAEYSHDDGCSVTGGYRYRGSALPALRGIYLYGDYCSGRIWSLYQDAAGSWQTNDPLQTDAQISSFGVDESGELYVTDLSSGVIYHVVVR